MAVKQPQRDLPHGVRGGSDVWDQEFAGGLLTADYFESAAMPVVNESGSTGAVFSSIVEGGVTYRVAYFAASGTLDITTGGAFEWELVPAGGSGAGTNDNYLGGGGGAGGLPKLGSGNIPAGLRAIIVGLGGAAPGTNESGNDGGPSSIEDIDSQDGGGGGGRPGQNGRPGSNGGGAGGGLGSPLSGGASTAGGYPGGDLLDPGAGIGAGGAGAGAKGADSQGAGAGWPGSPGGVGVETTFGGTPRRVGGGGGAAGRRAASRKSNSPSSSEVDSLRGRGSS